MQILLNLTKKHNILIDNKFHLRHVNDLICKRYLINLKKLELRIERLLQKILDQEL